MSEIMVRKTWLDKSFLVFSSIPVVGSKQLLCNHVSIALRSYVNPASCRWHAVSRLVVLFFCSGSHTVMTGSFITSVVIGHKKWSMLHGKLGALGHCDIAVTTSADWSLHVSGEGPGVSAGGTLIAGSDIRLFLLLCLG